MKKKMTTIARVVLLGATLLPCGVVADVSTVWKNIFHTMENWNLPDVTGAALVAPDLKRRPEVTCTEFPYAWLTAGQRAEDGTPEWGELVADGFRRLHVEWHPGRRLRAMETPSIYVTPEPLPPVLYGTWEPVNITEVVEAGVKALQDARWYGHPDRYEQSRYLLLAYQLWTRGDSDSLLPLLEELEEAVGGAAGAAHDALQFAAGVEYEELYLAWQADRDWVAYRDGVQALMEKYGTAWDGHRVMQRLLDALALRWELGGADSPEALLNRVQSVCALRNSKWSADQDEKMSTWWLFPSAWSNQVASPPDAEMVIYRMGIRAIPLLVSWWNNPTPIGVDRQYVARGEDGSYYQDDIDFSGWSIWREHDRSVDGLYNRLPRPATLGEVAQHWLSRLVPKWVNSSANSRRDRKKALFEQALSFYGEIQDASEVGAAVYYLPGRFSGFHPPVENAILKQAETRRLPELEQFLFESKWIEPDASDYDIQRAWNAKTDLLFKYVLRRGEEAQPLLAQYAAMMEQFATNETNKAENPDLPAKERDGAVKQAETWSKLVDTVNTRIALMSGVTHIWTVDDLATYLSSGVPYDSDLVFMQLDRLDERTRFEAYLAFAALSDGNDVKRRVQYILKRNREWASHASGTTGADYWRVLIQTDIPAFPRLLSHLYVGLYEYFFADPPREEKPYARWDYNSWAEARPFHFMDAYGDVGYRWLRARVEQRLNGVPEAELPQYEEVDAASSDAALLQSVAKSFEKAATREEAQRIMAGLSPLQQMALPFALTADPDLNVRLLALSATLERVDIQGAGGGQDSSFAEWQGAPVAMGWVDELTCWIEAYSEQGRPAVAILTYGADFAGWSLSIKEGCDAANENSSPKNRKTGYIQLIYGPDIYAMTITGVHDEDTSFFPTSSTGPFERNEFNRAVEEMFSNRPLASEERTLYIRTMETCK